MSFTNHTPNYNLPQYVGTDKPTFLGDFNNAMTTIDTQMHNNAQNAGKGIAALQQAQAALSQTQETLTEVQTEVANVSGIAANVNTNVQQALSAANDATTAANNATSQIQPAVAAANKASADAQAAQQVANGNVATLNQLTERVETLENEMAEMTWVNLRSSISSKLTPGKYVRVSWSTDLSQYRYIVFCQAQDGLNAGGNVTASGCKIIFSLVQYKTLFACVGNIESGAGYIQFNQSGSPTMGNYVAYGLK